MTFEDILYDTEDAIATITLNRPDKLNAWTRRMEFDVRNALSAATEDDGVRVIIMTGAGRGYCAGADMDLLSGISNKSGAAASFETNVGAMENGLDLPDDFSRRNTFCPPWTLPAGTKLLSGVSGQSLVVLSASAYQAALLAGAEVFETMHAVELRPTHNELRFYTWGARDLTLAAGATSATLHGHSPQLQAGDVLILEELTSPEATLLEDGSNEDASSGPSTLRASGAVARTGGQHCHAVRLIQVLQREDALGAQLDLDGTATATLCDHGQTPPRGRRGHRHSALDGKLVYGGDRRCTHRQPPGGCRVSGRTTGLSGTRTGQWL